MTAHDPPLDVAHGDRDLSDMLRKSLAILRSHTDDPHARAHIDDVLAGRCSLRDAVQHPEFNALLDRPSWEVLATGPRDRPVVRDRPPPGLPPWLQALTFNADEEDYGGRDGYTFLR